MPNKNKAKIKDFVGRSINAYHKEAVKQIAEIKKNNIEQDHKIAILSKEFEKEHITKTGEGPVMSLASSKEGMVSINEIEGNTMVNYCAYNFKEMILNGDIDLEGNLITTDQGVDNGLVDVMCEGNTLMNFNKPVTYEFAAAGENDGRYTKTQSLRRVTVDITEQLSSWFYASAGFIKHELLKPSTTYTVFFKEALNVTRVVFMSGNALYTLSDSYPISGNKVVITTRPTLPTVPDDYSICLYCYVNGSPGTTIRISDAVIVEGNYSHIDNISYFDDMRSVGEKDNGTGEIKVLAKNSINEIKGNGIVGDLLINTDGDIANGGSADLYFSSDDFEEIEPNTRYYFWHSRNGVIGNNGQFVYFYNENKKLINGRQQSCTSFVSYPDAKYFKMMIHRGDPLSSDIKFIVTRNNTKPTSFDSKTSSNKKSFMLNEPLRGIPNGVKDRFVKISGKWYIERNCRKLILNGNENWYLSGTLPTNTDFTRFDYALNLLPGKNYPLVCDSLPYIFIHGLSGGSSSIEQECITNHSGEPLLSIVIKKSKLADVSSKSFKQWLSDNNITVVYQLATPTYESLEIDPEFKCYTDCTNIYNDSLIPCNMKVKNTGYNVIIKPNTKYTVIANENKYLPLTFNLGGAKKTAAIEYNMDVITTPSTLVDDSLRISSKGNNVRHIRVLEGDYTNNPPAVFGGLLSSFEDKQNTIKLRAVNENLLDVNAAVSYPTSLHKVEVADNGFKITSNSNQSGWIYTEVKFPMTLKPNTRYTFKCDIEKTNPNSKPCIRIYRLRDNRDYAFMFESGERSFKTPISGVEDIRILIYSSIDNAPVEVGDVFKFKNISITEQPTSKYIKHLHNELSLQLSEPLRSVPTGQKDRLVLMNNKIMIERNCGKVIINSSKGFMVSAGGWENKTKVTTFESYHPTPEAIVDSTRSIISNSIPTVEFAKQWSGSGETGMEAMSTHYIGGFVISIEKRKLATQDLAGFDAYLKANPLTVIYALKQPYYEEVDTELSKLILECYNNGALVIDTVIPPNITTRYSGEASIVTAVKSNVAPVQTNTSDINEFIVPYLMDMDYRLLCLQMENPEKTQMSKLNMATLFGSVYDMLKQDILSKRYSPMEYSKRLDLYNKAKKLTEDEYKELGGMLNE